MRNLTSADRVEFIVRCERILGHRFLNPDPLFEALTHASIANHRLQSNERLEFLGDAVLGLIVSERLYRDFPDYLEGDLTRVKSVVVSRRTCARLSTSLGLDSLLAIGKGMKGVGPPPSSVLADVFESVLGAIYLDGGLEASRRFLEPLVLPIITATVEGNAGSNYKSQFQHAAQQQYGITPTYELLEESGPDHSKRFQIAAVVGSTRFPSAWGKTKKDAEQRAARNALEAIEGQEIVSSGGEGAGSPLAEPTEAPQD